MNSEQGGTTPRVVPFSFDAKRYPTAPGCYLMKDGAGRILYIGKAKSLRHRLSSYFRTTLRERRTRQLVSRIAEIEVILVHSEIEALVLENNLIKQHQPRYNRLLRAEDSGYTYIVLTDEPYPRFAPFRKFRPNLVLGDEAEARRFGPYLSSHYRDILLEYVNAAFQLRTCQPLGARLCLRFHMHKCSGICAAQSRRKPTPRRSPGPWLSSPSHTWRSPTRCGNGWLPMPSDSNSSRRSASVTRWSR